MKYDVAISLRWTDVETARELNEALRERLQVFFADEKQQELVGKDGEDSFGYIFRDEARIVVVLYREDWGQTPFTRAEEAAIKQRAWRDGYGFSVWVPMGAKKEIPPYLPPQYLWFDFDRYGVSGLAAVVEEKVRESGKAVRQETSQDRLRKLKRSIARETDRKRFEGSIDGVKFFREERSRAQTVVENQVAEYLQIDPEIPFQVSEQSGMTQVESWPYRCFLRWDPYASNSIREASLTAITQMVSGDTFRTGWSNIREEVFKPTLDDEGQPKWRDESGRYHTLEVVVESVLDRMAESAYSAKAERVRKS